MSSNAQATNQPPKIRSSCDACGAAKLKCDRKRPECGRCISHGTSCVYSLSRKIGKPPRDRVKSIGPSAPINNRPSTSHDAMPGIGNALVSPAWEPGRANHNAGESGSRGDVATSTGGLDLDMGTLPNSSVWMLPEAPMTAFDPVDLEEWPAGNFFDADRFIETPPASHSDQTIVFAGPSTINKEKAILNEEHACLRETQDLILRSLSASHLHNATPAVRDENTTVRLGAPYDRADRIALDDLLLLNRNCRERMSSLLACSCASSPPRMMLYASIISTMLRRYQEAAEDTLNLSSDDDVTSTTPNSSANTDSSTTPGSQFLLSPTMGAASVSVGGFMVEDQRIQSALKIQLLAGEMRQMTRVVTQFSSCYANRSHADEKSTSYGVDELNQNLSQWLFREHTRISDSIKKMLKDLST
ncbi:hypothetical protein F4777DRAFT_408858 [Nemania sp. FL0916]|nr:hypothetical protein F4777DRAFT_408858 [Nemania sp. FL0916]